MCEAHYNNKFHFIGISLKRIDCNCGAQEAAYGHQTDLQSQNIL
jgi:hypothetical protein